MEYVLLKGSDEEITGIAYNRLDSFIKQLFDSKYMREDCLFLNSPSFICNMQSTVQQFLTSAPFLSYLNHIHFRNINSSAQKSATPYYLAPSAAKYCIVVHTSLL